MRRFRASANIRRFRLGAIASAGVLILSFAGLSAAREAAAVPTPAPTAIAATASTDNTGLGGAVPAVLVQRGGAFSLTVDLQPAGSSFNTATKLNLKASLEPLPDGPPPGAPAGSLSPSSVVMPANVTSATFSLTYSAIDNRVVVEVSVAKKNSGVTPGKTLPFDVLKTLKTFESSPGLANGIGVGNADCAQTTNESECGILFLSRGFPSPTGDERAALSLGACTDGLNCTTGSQVVQFIANLGDEYTSENPALLVIRCSKALCQGKGLNSYTIKVSFDPSGELDRVSQPCLQKGVALDAARHTFCTDYVQSHRDNAGDALLYLLFTSDMRGST